MTLISFQHSIKYIYLQLLPYAILVIATGYMAYHFDALWIVFYLIISGILAWQLIELTSVQYFFTHDMLVVSKGVIFKTVKCRALWQLKGMEVKHNKLLGFLHVSHIQCGLEGPPADRIRITGVDDHAMVKILEQLNEAIEANLNMWREHFKNGNA